MRAKLFANSMQCGHIARDFIDLTRRNQKSALAGTGREGKAARVVLESFEDQNRALPIDPVVPIQRLVTVLTESLQGMPSLVSDNGRPSGASLFRGLKVRLRGVPGRKFAIRDIYWDFQEVRVSEIGAEVDYVVPWDCLRFHAEQGE